MQPLWDRIEDRRGLYKGTQHSQENETQRDPCTAGNWGKCYNTSEENETFKEKLLAATTVNAESESKSSMHYISSGIEHLIKKEFYFFYTNNTKGKFLTRVEKWLDIIRPTSVEAERCLSAAGLFASKVRNRLGDEILSVLQILRFYFAKHANKQDAP